MTKEPPPHNANADAHQHAAQAHAHAAQAHFVKKNGGNSKSMTLEMLANVANVANIANSDCLAYMYMVCQETLYTEDVFDEQSSGF